jgi:uncharacterized cupin superfamily protein
MGYDKSVIRLERFGPADSGMVKMQLDPEMFQSELPVQHQHVYFSDEVLGLEVGVWDTTSMQEAFGPYPGDEFMWVLEGQASMVDGEDKSTTILEGQTFCIRNAIPISWKQDGFLRKFYMTYADPDAPAPEIATARGGVQVLDPDLLENSLSDLDSTDPFEINHQTPRQRDSLFFTNDTGNMNVGMWDSTPFESEMRPFRFHEFVQLLEGEVTITEQDGTSRVFNAGDMFFIPMGTVCSWKATGYIKKYYAILDPRVA